MTSSFVPSLGLEDVIAHIEALTRFPQQAVNLYDSEISLIRKAVLQNWLDLDIITASYIGTCAIMQAECCVLTPGESSNVTNLMSHVKIQINAMNDPMPSFVETLKGWLGSGESRLRSLLMTSLLIAAILISVCVL